MNVPNIGQDVRATAVLTRPQAGDIVVLPRREGSGSGGSERVRQHSTDSNVSFARVGWFDVNGDGHIDGRSPMAGGDGTLLLPHVVKVPTYTRQVLRSAGSEVAEPAPDAKTTTEEAPAHPATEAQTRQAISAYERYGQPTNTAPSDRAVA